MSVVLQTGVMQYRENEQDTWHPLIIKAETDFSALIDPYDPTATKTWVVGEYCLYDNRFRRCITQTSTPGAFDPTKWVETTIGDELEAVKASIASEATTRASEDTSIRNTLNQLDQNMAYVESGNTASRNYTKGQFISWKGTLYTVSPDNGISSGVSFSTGIGGNLDLVAGNNALGGGLNALKSIISDLVVTSTFTFQNTGSVAAGGNKQFADVDISSAVPLGYKMIGCFPINTGDKMFNIFLLIPNYANKTVTINIANVGSSATSGTPQINVVSIRDI